MTPEDPPKGHQNGPPKGLRSGFAINRVVSRNSQHLPSENTYFDPLAASKWMIFLLPGASGKALATHHSTKQLQAPAWRPKGSKKRSPKQF